MRERLFPDQVGEPDPGTPAQRGAHVAAQQVGIDVDLLEQGARVGLVVARCRPYRVAVDARLAGGRVERPFHRQPQFRRHRVEFRHRPGRGVVAQRECPRLDVPQQVDHPPVLEPDLVVEEPPQLLGQLPHRLLRRACGPQPVVVYVSQPRIAVGVPRQLVHPVKKVRQFPLTGA